MRPGAPPGVLPRWSVWVWAWVICAGTLLASCGVPLSQWEAERELLAADRLADRGEHAQALVAYRRLQTELTRADLVRYAAFREGLMLERQGHSEEALRVYALLWQAPVSLHDERAAQALYRTALIHDAAGRAEDGVAIREHVIVRFPNTLWATDAFRDLRRIWRETGRPETQLEWTARVFPALRNTEMADTLLYHAGVVLADELGECTLAIEAFTLVVDRFTRSSLVDDAIWRHAGCYREMGLQVAEERLLTDFIDGREISLFMGNYDSQFYNPALQRLIEMRREEGDVLGELQTIERLLETFPLTLQAPRWRFRLAELHGMRGDVAAMKREAQRVERDHPDSRWIERTWRLVQEAHAGP